MRVFIDTSAIYALGSLSDEYHTRAKERLRILIDKDCEFVTSNYCLLECTSLLQRRQGLSITKKFVERICANIGILWLNEAMHKKAWEYWKGSWKRGLSMVDCSSFILMRQEGIKQAFSFDKQFLEAGFELV